MPTYEYVCRSGHEYSEQRSIHDEQQQFVCPLPDCGTELVRRFESTPVKFNATGFYRTGG